MTKLLRSIYIEPTLDMLLASRAENLGISKSELIERFIEAGLKRAAEEKPTNEDF